MPHWSLPRPIASTHLMIRLAAHYGVSFERCVEGTGVTRAELADPLTEIEGKQELAVLRNILRALDPSVPFGLEAGLRYHVTTHGMWGFALVSSADIRSAVDLSLRYFDLTFSFNRIHFEVVGPYARSYYDATDNPDDLQAVLVERDLAALLTLEREGLGRVLPTHSLQLRSPAPAYAGAFKSMFGVTPQFNAPHNCIAIEARYLDDSGPLADELGLRVSEQQCRALLERRRAAFGVAGEVRRRILLRPGEIPRMPDIASELGLSTRTLRNHLARQTTSYRKLVEDVRLTLAEEMLSAGFLTIEKIAVRLGYADASSFGVAFKRWKGVAPGSYKSRAQR